MLEELATTLRTLAHRYSSGEGVMTSVLARLALGVTPLAVTFTWLASAVGVLPTGRVSVAVGAITDCTPPQGFAQLLERIPQSVSQVRIESFIENGVRRYVVYIAGTADFVPHVSANPWDMTSNLQAISDVAIADSEASVREAMRQAGIDATSPVIVVGHSQGGLIASRLAESGDFTVTDIVLAGSPSHRVSLPESVRVTAFEHTEDFIPALSGPVLGAAATGVVFVRRSAPALSPGVSLPTHDLRGYVATAREADGSKDAVIRARARAIARNDGEKCTGTDFTATRLKN
jgi:hypothetical protein